MGDGEIDFSLDSVFDEMVKDMPVCTHTHTCNPPGLDNTHTHTCLHVHTKIVPASTEEKSTTEVTAESADNKSKGRPFGNREAVRKYREKKKAQAASLEEEVERLRVVNQKLVKGVQGHAALEAEVTRLKCLLVEIRGRIDGEIGCFPYQKAVNPSINGGIVPNHHNVPIVDRIYCPYPGLEKNSMGNRVDAHGLTGCDLNELQRLCDPSIKVSDLLDCDAGNGTTNVSPSGAKEGKGGTRAADTGKNQF